VTFCVRVQLLLVMLTKLRLAILAAFVAAFAIAPTSHAQGVGMSGVSSTNLGYATATACSGTTTSAAFSMESSSGYYNRLTVVTVMVWGTSTSVALRLLASADGTSYGPVGPCTAGTASTCTGHTFTWASASGTVWVFDWATNYRYLKLEYTCTGSGTVKPTVILGKN
jgi:hypothetical protein